MSKDYLLVTKTPDGQKSETWYDNLRLAQSRAERARRYGNAATIYLLIDGLLLPESEW